jgi:ATP-dependent NAD(P)H-hydrate dehydratase
MPHCACRRLATTMGVSLHGPNNDRLRKLADVTQQLQGPVVVSKGPVDAIHDGRNAVLCSTGGGKDLCNCLPRALRRACVAASMYPD